MSIEPEERVLDWVPRFDEKSKEFPVRAAIRSEVVRKDQLWTPGPIMDQGREGACVGFAWAAEAFGDPIPVDINRLRVHTPRNHNDYAKFVYKTAQFIDEWAGENYDGTSVLAGAKASQNMGVLAKYSWAFNINDVIDAVITKGPVVIGIKWFDGMYNAPNGVLKKSGTYVGGHALKITGFKLKSTKIPGKSTFIIQNSWGKAWGINGLAEISVEDLAALLQDGGEACVPVSRSYGR